MNKGELVNYIAEKHDCTKVEADKTIDRFISSVISALSEGKSISLVGFGSFSVSKIAARTGRNPKTQKPMKLPAYNQVRFKTGQKLKDACNPKKKK